MQPVITSGEPDFRAIFGRRPRVVIGHPCIGRGGSESKVMWSLQALAPDCDLTVVTTAGGDLDALNRYYGTSISPGQVTVRYAPFPRALQRRSAAALRGAMFERFARRIAPEYDIRISAYNFTDWGLPAIHFVADFSWNMELSRASDPRPPGLIYRRTPLRRLYLGACRALNPPSGRDVPRDFIVANSRWTAGLLASAGRPSTAMLYPPVWASFPAVPWAEKEDAFVMIGRIAPEKRIGRAVSIVSRLRQAGFPLKLRVCGPIGSDPYGRVVQRLCSQNADWLIPEGQVSGDRKARILASCKFGIQTCAAEAFGISVAEMARAGAIVFAPSDGGQAEILENPLLTFSSEDDAVEKIRAVLLDAALQTRLRAHLAARAEVFSIQSYVRDYRRLVATSLDRAFAAA